VRNAPPMTSSLPRSSRQRTSPSMPDSATGTKALPSKRRTADSAVRSASTGWPPCHASRAFTCPQGSSIVPRPSQAVPFQRWTVGVEPKATAVSSYARSPTPRTSSELQGAPPVPAPSADQAFVSPLRAATPDAATPPMLEKSPPTNSQDVAGSNPARTASVRTRPFGSPTADQAAPSQAARLPSGVPPEVEKLPPAYSRPPKAASAWTLLPKGPIRPGPSPAQAAPSQRATLTAVCPAIDENCPPATSAPWNSAKAWITPFTPPGAPRLCQVLPSKLATV